MGDVRPQAPVGVPWSWQLRAACRHLTPSTFFPPENERGQTRARREKRAKQACAGCPVRAQCRRYALSVREPHGIWGGLTESERQAILRGRAAGTARR